MRMERPSVRIRSMSFVGSLHTSRGLVHFSSRNNRPRGGESWIVLSSPPSLLEDKSVADSPPPTTCAHEGFIVTPESSVRARF